MNYKTTLDASPLTPFHLRLVLLVFSAHMIDGYALGVIGYVIDYYETQQNISPVVQGLLGSSALPGLFLGSMILGRMADKYGRNTLFIVSFVIIFIASLLQFFFYSIPGIILLRFILGVGIGGDYAVGLTLLAEFLPKKQRGVLLGLFSPVWTVGYVIAIASARYFVTTPDPDTVRLLLAFPAGPALLILLFRLGIPESPVWLLSRERISDARKVLAQYFPRAEIVLSEGNIRHTHPSSGLFSAQIWRSTLFASLFFICIVLPYFAIYTFLPFFLEKMPVLTFMQRGISMEVFLLFGALFGLWLTRQFPRRQFTLVSFGVLGLCLITLVVADSALVISLSFALFTLLISAISNLTGVYLPECFPTALRSSGVGFATAMSRIGAALGTFLLPIIVEGYGMEVCLLLLSAVLLIGLAATWYWAPRGNAHSLE
ncbi:MFS transporter [Escherichia albertii]